MSNSIACIGGLVWDETMRPLGSMIQGTSNPVTSSGSCGGVAHNVAVGLAGLGVQVSLFSIVGRDRQGDEIVDRLHATSIDGSGVTRSDHGSTARYIAVLDPHGELVYGLADMQIFLEMGEDWCDACEETLAGHPIWVVDSNLPATALRRLLLDNRGRAVILLDPVSVAKSARLTGLLGGVDVLFPDRQEVAALSGLPTDSIDQAGLAAMHLLELGTKRVVVSLGEEGVCVVGERGAEHRPAIEVQAVGDVTGAGDALLAGYVYGLLKQSETDPIDYGLAAASLIVESSGASDGTLTPERLTERLRRG